MLRFASCQRGPQVRLSRRDRRTNVDSSSGPFDERQCVSGRKWGTARMITLGQNQECRAGQPGTESRDPSSTCRKDSSSYVAEVKATGRQVWSLDHAVHRDASENRFKSIASVRRRMSSSFMVSSAPDLVLRGSSMFLQTEAVCYVHPRVAKAFLCSVSTPTFVPLLLISALASMNSSQR